MTISTKLSRDIARGKGHLVHKYDLKWPSPREMAAILRVKKFHLALLLLVMEQPVIEIHMQVETEH